MANFRVRINPHNTLLNLAHYQVGIVEEKLATGKEDGIVLDCTSAIIAMAFSVEALMNYVGQKKIADWKERAAFKKKIERLEAVLGFHFDATAEPFKTIRLLKEARDTMAHGQPVEFQVSVPSSKKLGPALQPTWSAVTQPQVVVAAHKQLKAFQKLLFGLGKIKPGAALTSAVGG